RPEPPHGQRRVGGEDEQAFETTHGGPLVATFADLAFRSRCVLPPSSGSPPVLAARSRTIAVAPQPEAAGARGGCGSAVRAPRPPPGARAGCAVGPPAPGSRGGAPGPRGARNAMRSVTLIPSTPRKGKVSGIRQM